MDPGDLEIHRHRHTIASNKGSSTFEDVTEICQLILEVIPVEPVCAVQQEFFSLLWRSCDEVVRCRRKRSVRASLGDNVIFTPVSVCTSVPLGLLQSRLLLDHGHY